MGVATSHYSREDVSIARAWLSFGQFPIGVHCSVRIRRMALRTGDRNRARPKITQAVPQKHEGNAKE